MDCQQRRRLGIGILTLAALPMASALATPLLTALADNGGPTRSMVLLTGSPALSAAVAPCAATDQRSTTRPQGNGCDSGAFESALLAALGIKRVGRRRF